jgi:hypothetical protein
MEQFYLDLIANIVGGVAAALLFALIVYIWDQRRRRTLKELVDIMGKAIEHRNAGKRGSYANAETWVSDAKAIEEAAMFKARELSPAAGALIEWLDQVPPYSEGEVNRYVAILSAVIERLRGLVEKHT